jgi:GntR family transcriptional repressor for pyruvate dehydrogenase complex
MQTNSQRPKLSMPLNKGSVVIQIIDRFKAALLSGELRPGDYIPSESELTKSLGVGKSSVREAIKMLQAMGILEVRRGQGTLIRETPGNDYIDSLVFQLLLSKGLTQDFIDLRLMFEPAYTLMAMKRATPEDKKRIAETVRNMEQAIQDGKQTAEHDIAFHLAILESTHNPLVIRIGEIILKVYEASIHTSMKIIPDVNLEDHKRIYKAFCDQNAEELCEAIQLCAQRWDKCLRHKP